MTKHIIQLLRPILLISILLFSLLIGKHSALCLHCFSFQSLETLEFSIQKGLIEVDSWLRAYAALGGPEFSSRTHFEKLKIPSSGICL